MHLQPGSLLQGGKYKIVRFISSGGFGCTYEAEHVMLGERIAVKEFFVKDFCNRDATTLHVTVGTLSKKGLVEKLKRKFVDEARSVFQLHHPGIVRVIDIFEENGTAYYVMDYIDGPSLHELVKRRGALPEAEALGYVRQVAVALQYVHEHNRLHLDIKPGNIMVDGSGHAVLIDFGASKQYDEQDGENTSTLLGKTPGYAPLEQMGNDVVKFLPATDIYALGATLYKLLTGETPPSANLLASGEELPPLPSSVSPATRRAVSAAMQTNKRHRPQTMREFLSLLGEEPEPEAEVTELDTDPEVPVEPKAAPKAVSLPIRRNLVIVACIVLLALVLMTRPWRSSKVELPVQEEQRIETEQVEPAVMDSLYIPELEDSAVVIAPEANKSVSRPLQGTVNGHEWVDLGLSVRWATCNVGASRPSDYGNYYAWGEISTKPEGEYIDETCLTCGKSIGDISGNSKYDVACARWKKPWRLPTKEEMEELMQKCTWVWTTQKGHSGYLVTGAYNNSIFLPAAGGWYDNHFYAGSNGYYWSSTPGVDTYAYSLGFYNGRQDVDPDMRRFGYSIRPVMD